MAAALRLASRIREALFVDFNAGAHDRCPAPLQPRVIIASRPPPGLVVAGVAPLYQIAKQILDHARRLRLPSISSFPAAWAEAGGLVSYGQNFLESCRYAATYVDRILKGVKPADLPIEQPAKFEFAINLGTAREIGLKIPQSVLLRADRVIE